MNGLLDMLKGRRYDILCDCCGATAQGHDIFVDKGVYLGSTGNCFPVCATCFSKGFTEVKIDSLYGRNSSECASCRCKLIREKSTINDHVKFICKGCLQIKGHPSNAHTFRKGRDWEICEGCGTAKVTTNGTENYWITGSTIPQKKPFAACLPGYTGMNELKKYCGNNHSFITLRDTTKNRSDVKKITKIDIRSANAAMSVPGYEQLMPITSVDLAYGRCGYKLQWCSKCGHIERELPDWWTDVL